MTQSDDGHDPAHHASPSSDRPPPFRIGDHMALDVLNSVAAPWGDTIDWIGSGEDLLDWLLGAGAISPADATQIRIAFSTAKLNTIATAATQLREWFRGVVAEAKSTGVGRLAAADIARLNGVLAQDTSYVQIEPAAGNGAWSVVPHRAWRTPAEVLAPLAAAMADLIAHGDFALIRKCENPQCTIWFYDRTKGHRRRWCSQSMCGNRAKVAAYRERQRAI
jgi:predicted RNA-binding Zn ribbon-like protein